MKPEKLVQLLTEAVKKVGYRVRTEEGNFRGGSCVFAEERLVILNRRMTQEERAEVLGRVLASDNFETIFLLPEVRSFIEKFIPPLETPAATETQPEDKTPEETPPEAATENSPENPGGEPEA